MGPKKKAQSRARVPFLAANKEQGTRKLKRGRGCVALRHSAAQDELWMPCPAPAQPGDMFCRLHREAANEIALGLANREPSENELRGIISEAARMLAALSPAGKMAGHAPFLRT